MPHRARNTDQLNAIDPFIKKFFRLKREATLSGQRIGAWHSVSGARPVAFSGIQ